MAVASFFTLTALAQGQPDLFPDLIRYRNTGWLIEPGMTYQINDEEVDILAVLPNSDSLEVNAEAKAKIGGSFLFGLHHYFRNGIIVNDIDYGIGVKYFRGAENQTGSIRDDANSSTPFEETLNWQELQASFSLNLNRIFQINRSFLKIGVGADINYRLLYQLEENFVSEPIVNTNPDKWVSQYHVSLGYGFPMGERWYFTPKVEIPLYDLGFNKEASVSHYLVLQRPIIFTLQFTNRWFRRQDGCGPGEIPVDLNDRKRKRKNKKGIKNGQIR